MKKKKKSLRLCNKKHLYMLDKPQNKKHLATAKQLIRKNSAYCLKIRQFFFTKRSTDRLSRENLVVLKFLLEVPRFKENVLTCIITVIKVRDLLLTVNNNTCAIVSEMNKHRLHITPVILRITSQDV